MPLKTKRRRHLANIVNVRRDKVKRHQIDEGALSSIVGVAPKCDQHLLRLVQQSDDALDTDDENVDPSFNLDCRMKSDSEHVTESFCDKWVTQLDWEDRTSLGLFLCFQLTSLLGKHETEAAELAGMMIGKSDRTIRE